MGNLKKVKVGELRPSQLLYTFGVGSIIDLPNMSVMVMGLDDWNLTHSHIIAEERLLKVVQAKIGDSVQELRTPPLAPDEGNRPFYVLDPSNIIGIPVATFPRWMVCPYCRQLAPLDSGPFRLKADLAHPLRNRYVHINCRAKKPPVVQPARFMVACDHGHLDDFPWREFVHRQGNPCPQLNLKLIESGISGEASDLLVVCEQCDAKRSMSDSFGEDADPIIKVCRSRRPHLRDLEEEECPTIKEKGARTILMGASNCWFACTLSALSIPKTTDPLVEIVEKNWGRLQKAKSPDSIEAYLDTGALSAPGYTAEEIWEAVKKKKESESDSPEEESVDLKAPEWEVFSKAQAITTSDFKITLEKDSVPVGYEDYFEKVVLVERIREVQALIGFTRIASPFEFGDLEDKPEERMAPLSRKASKWIPGSEIRGEGIFIQFKEAFLQKWLKNKAVKKLEETFFKAHARYRGRLGIDNPRAGFPGMRYVLLHSFSHALLRQFSLDCGYSAAAIRERIYSQNDSVDTSPMAGILLYTAAPDSEGTMGGLVGLGEKDTLRKHLNQTLERIRFCSSDPLCSEYDPLEDPFSIHGAACHTCLYMPETSCEKGNKYLDRSVLVETLSDHSQKVAFFKGE